MRISYAMECRGFCRVSGNRLFVPVNLFAKKLFIQHTERINPLENDRGSCYHDILTYQLPEGYSVESVPDSVQHPLSWSVPDNSFPYFFSPGSGLTSSAS